MILNDLYQSKLGLEAPRFSTNSLKLLSKCCIFWTDRAILATLSGRYAILVYNAIYDRVSRYGAYKRVNITYFLDENHQTSQTYWKIMLCLFIDLLIKSGSFCPKQCAISCANHRKNLKRNLIIRYLKGFLCNTENFELKFVTLFRYSVNRRFLPHIL